MELSSWPRHQLRIQSRRRDRSHNSDDRKVGPVEESPAKVDELLDFLAQTAGTAERDLLRPSTEVDLFSEPDLPGINAKAYPKMAQINLVPLNSAPLQDKTQLGYLADAISEQAKAIRYKQSDLYAQCSRILDKDGVGNTLAAVFVVDGFRMMTRFQAAHEEKIRFYGRDGSVIEFSSEKDLKASRPTSMWPPGSRPVRSPWNEGMHAASAWESVQEYIAKYLPAT
jgi:hypothetical protein